MEEVKAPALFFPFDVLFGKMVILFHDLREIFLPDGILFLRLCHHRFDRHTAEAQICKFHHVFGEIQIMTGKGSTDVIIPVASHLGKLLELGNN